MKAKKILTVIIAAAMIVSLTAFPVSAGGNDVVCEDPVILTEAELVVISAEATAADEVTVVMSTDIPEGTTVTLKKGTIGIVTTKAVDGNTVVLTGLYPFNPGTYTVTVGKAVSVPFDISTQTATELTVGAENIYLEDAEQDLEVKLADQYGDEMSLSGVNVSVFNKDTGYVFSTNGITTLTINPIDDTAVESEDTIVVFIYDPVSQLQATATVLLNEARQLVSLTIGDITLGDEDAARLYEGSEDNILDVEGVDQYGNTMDITGAMITDGTLQILMSDPDCIASGSQKIIDGDIYFDAGVPGDIAYTMILPRASFVSTTETITVYSNPILDEMSINSPEEPVYAMEEIEITALGTDQYEDQIDFCNADYITFSVSNNAVMDSGDFIIESNKISITPQADGETTVFYYLNGKLKGSFDISVLPQARPYSIEEVDFYGAMQGGTTLSLNQSDITVLDQYGREMTTAEAFSTLYDGSYYLYNVTGGGDSIEVFEDTPGEQYLFSAGTETGVDSFTALLTYEGNPLPESGTVFEVAMVDDEDITYSMAVDTEGIMYTGDVFEWGQSAEDYIKFIEFTGKTKEGLSVYLNTTHGKLPVAIDLVTSSNDAIEIRSDTKIVPTAAVDGSTIIKAWVQGKVVASVEIDLSDSIPVLTKIEEAQSEPNWNTEETFLFTAFDYFDQYGVYLSPAGLYSDGLILSETADSMADYQIISETGIWWYMSIKYDGSVWKTLFVNEEDIFPVD